MKNTIRIMAITMAIMMMTGMATAGSVNIGMGHMDQAEFDALKQMVSGQNRTSPSSISTPINRDTRVAEFNRSDVEAIRLAMNDTVDQEQTSASASGNGMVDIGTGAMTTAEFCNLNNLVASNSATPNSGFDHLCP